MGAPGIEVGEGDDRPRLTWADFGPLLQGLLAVTEGSLDSLSATGFDSALGQIRDSLLAMLAPEWRAEGRPATGGSAAAPVAVARLLRALADLLDGGRGQ